MAEGGVVHHQHLYQQECDDIFDKKGYFEEIHKQAKSGFLKNSRFRSVCWRLYLNVLPKEKTSWCHNVIVERTQYDELKLKHDVDPRLDIWKDPLSLILDNPLSTSQKSRWNCYFEDRHLQLEIHQDVTRTFPGQDLFKELDIQEMMTQILFIYARTYPKIQYKQGMHELLAPIIYVMQKDIKAYALAKEGVFQLWCNYLFMRKYIEHDCYAMFVKVMDIVASWYIMDYWEKNEENLNCVLYPANSLHIVLQDIWDHCKVYDREVYDHLTNLEITPQIYGIRWLKLLFGREFTFEDLLILWDVIMSDSTHRNIYKYIFIAMLISIRHLLLNSDYSSCLIYLMKFPRVESVQFIIHLAFHLRNPTKYRRPENMCSLKKKELPTKVKPVSDSSSVKLNNSSIGNYVTNSKTVKDSSEEESFLSVEGSDFFEPSTSLSSYGSFPLSRIPNVMGIATQTQRASELIRNLQGAANDYKTLGRSSREMEPITPCIKRDVPRKEVSVKYRRPENTSSLKKKELPTKVKTLFDSSSVKLSNSSIGKNCATRPKTVKGLFSKNSSEEESFLSVECSDFSEPPHTFTSLSSNGSSANDYKTRKQGSSSREMEPIFPCMQNDVPRREVSALSLQDVFDHINYLSSTILNMTKKNDHCLEVLGRVLEDIRDVAHNHVSSSGAKKLIAALQELDRIKLVLKDMIPYDGSPHSGEESLSDKVSKLGLVQDVAGLAAKESEGL